MTMTFLYFISQTIITTYIPIVAKNDLNFSNSEIASLSPYWSLAVSLIRLSSATFLTKISIRHYLIFAFILDGIISFAVI